MNKIFYFLLFFIFSIYSKSIAQLQYRINFQENEKNEIQKEYHKILIIGKGSVANRFLFDEVFASLSKKLIKKSIITEPQFFLETESEYSNEKEIVQQEVLKEKYDALFFIIPKEISPNAAVIHNESTVNTINNATTAVHFAAPQFPQFGVVAMNNFVGKGKYFLEVFEPQNLDKEIWSATLDVDVTVESYRTYKLIANKIFESFVNNHLCKN